jgi:nicotinamidase-related amidase
MAVWDDVLTGRDRALYERVLVERALGHRPAVIVIDVNYAFVGTRPMPIEEAIEEYRTSCGEIGWEAIPRIRQLTDTARELGVPIFYSTALSTAYDRGSTVRGIGWGQDPGRPPKRRKSDEAIAKQIKGNEIVEELGKQPDDFLIEKTGASVFLGTPLVQQLIDLNVDTVILCGTTTSGCVRATAVEASNYNFHSAVVEDCTFDRFEISHKVSLMDVHAKYGRVISLGEALEYLKTSAEPSVAR